MTEISEQTVGLLLLGLDHGINSVRDGGPLAPFIIVERGAKRTLTRFHDDTPEASIAQAVSKVKAEPIAPGDR